VAVAPVPYALLCDHRLSLSAKVVYIYLWTRGCGEDWAPVSVRGAARALHLSETTALRAFRRLEETGWLRRRQVSAMRWEGWLPNSPLRPTRKD